MRYSILVSILFASPVFAQTQPSYPANPTITATKTVGQNLAVNWNAVTLNTDNSAITSAVQYLVYESTGPGIPFTLASTVTLGPASIALTAAGIPCFYVVAEEAVSTSQAPSGESLALPSAILCAQVKAATPVPQQVTGVVVY